MTRVTKTRSRRTATAPVRSETLRTTPPVPTRVGIPMLREAPAGCDTTNGHVTWFGGHEAIPILELRPGLSHGGRRYQRWLIAKARRARLPKPAPLPLCNP